MEAQVLPIKTRSEIGKNANHKLRTQGYIPAVLYSHGVSQAIMVEKKNFFKIFKGHISENLLIDLQFNDQHSAPVKAFIKDYQRNPITDEILHLDFFKVTMTETITTKAPIEIIGASIGVKQGGILEIIEREIEVECLPTDLPEKVQIDVTNLAMGQSIHVKDIILPKGVQILSSPESVIVAVLARHKATEEVVQPAEEQPQETVEEQ